MKKIFLCLVVIGSCMGLFAGEKRALTFEDMFTMKRISNLSVNPAGTHALFAVKQADIETNGSENSIWMVDLASGQLKQMVEGGGMPVWRPDGKAFIYTSAGQVWFKALDGSIARQVTAAEGGAWSPRFSPDGKQILFASSVFVGEEKDHSGRLMDGLLVRQWNSWVDEHRNHVFMVSADADRHPGKDLTPGMWDAPPLDLGSAHDFTFSPDGKEVAYVSNHDEMVAISTNNDIFVVNPHDGKSHKITKSKGGDAEPHYSPDGRHIAFTGMPRAGFEADQHIINLYDRTSGQITQLTHKYDAGNLVWSPDSKGMYFVSQVEGARSLFHIDLNSKVTRLTDTYYDGSLSIDKAGKTLVFLREATHMPAEVHVMDLATRKIRQVTFLNQPVLDELVMNPWEEFWFDSPNGDKVQGFMTKPPFFEEGKKYPMTFLIHGGPQGMWGNNFHYRWNNQMFAAPGHVVIAINPHGSKGYGQKFCDAVTKDWGGLPYEDLMKGLDVALERYPFIDADRMGAAGASYGGYMIAWIATHDNPFKALVCHNGVYNLPAMYGSTEELWFPEWEFGGSYYEHPELYEKWSPHRRAGNLKTPTLVVHSELDYRVPLTQGIEFYTALQRQGVPSQWLYFPDEDHFVTKPRNARMWWKTVYNWLGNHTKPKKPAGP